jgi:hypothetical protein
MILPKITQNLYNIFILAIKNVNMEYSLLPGHQLAEYKEFLEACVNVHIRICTVKACSDMWSDIFTEITCYRCGTKLEGTRFDKNEIQNETQDSSP